MAQLQPKEEVIVIPKESFYVKNKIGKAITGISFARNWKNIKAKDIIENDNEIATGADGIACLETDSKHVLLMLPFARIRPKITKTKEGDFLDLQLFSGSIITYVPPNAKSSLMIGHSKLTTEDGKFYAINDRKLNKYVIGVLTEQGEVTNPQQLKDQSLGLTTREYLISSDIKKQKIRKISWRLQKAARRMMEQCRANKINFKKMKEEAKRLYALLNVAEIDRTQQQNMDYTPVYDFPEHYTQKKFSSGFSYTNSSYALSEDTAGDIESSFGLASYGVYGRIERIFDFANTLTAMGWNTQAEFGLKDSSSLANAAGSTRNFLISLTFGPSFEINETTYFSWLLEYEQNDYLDTSNSTTGSYVINKGSVVSSIYALDKTFEFGLKQLHTHLFYKGNFMAPSYGGLYTGTSSLGLKLTYGSIFGGVSYFGLYESESFFNVSDTRTDNILSFGLGYTL